MDTALPEAHGPISWDCVAERHATALPRRHAPASRHDPGRAGGAPGRGEAFGRACPVTGPTARECTGAGRDGGLYT
ncbi:hypothetical protein SZ55_4270 [Pseudomonas sp. FeS53a]|nr:hypothetical protein SZ55_4270 [Pseudomonas sp. FeS53a]